MSEGRSENDDDPVLVQRRRAARLAAIGQRTGWALFGVAVVAFVTGFAAGWPQPTVTVVVVALVTGSVILAPAIVLGYAVRAAARDDREERRRG